MPLLSPTQIKSVLKESGVRTKKELQEILDSNGLGPDQVIEELGSTIRGADNSATRLRGLETALKLNGLLRNDQESIIPNVTILIRDSQYEVNPILIPRETI